MTKQWTILEALNWTEQRLARQGEEHPRLAAQTLMAHATGLSRIELYTSFDKPLTEEERTLLRESIKRRLENEPLQYITGSVGFRHLELTIRRPVLIPRPETETLVELVMEQMKEMEQSTPRILDVGTGSGAIALSLLDELAECTVCAVDIDEEAVQLAQENASRLELANTSRLELLLDDLASAIVSDVSLHASFDCVVSNPPYIPTAEYERLPAEIVQFENRLALDGGEDGLSVFRRLVCQAKALLKPGGFLAVELHEDTLGEAADFASCRGYTAVRIHNDLTGRERFLTAIRSVAELEAAGA